MRQMQVAFGFIKQSDKYLLQLRNGDPRIGGAGLIGNFGGKINDGEEPSATFCREVSEEVGLEPSPGDVRKLGMVKVISDHNLEPVEIIGHVFHWDLYDSKTPKIKEGKLVKMTLKEAMSNLDKMTTGTRAAFEELL